jgi:hypothetical protein
LSADIGGNQRPVRLLDGQLVEQLLADLTGRTGDQDTHAVLRAQSCADWLVDVRVVRAA